MIRGALRRLWAPAIAPVATTTVIAGARPPPLARTLTIATWNIAWGQGWGSELSGDAPMRTHAEIDRALTNMANHLRAHQVDVALLQEVDLAAARSGYVDQARELAIRAGLPWVTAASSWDVPYLPYPYWPPSRHAGRISSGGAILSRYPVSAGWIETLPKPSSKPSWYRAFYPARYLMGAVLDAGDGVLVHLAHVHLEAFDLDNRRLQAGIVSSRLAALARHTRLVFGGDLNTVPPTAAIRHGYPDEPLTDHRTDPTYAIIAGVAGVTSVLPAAARATDHTFPAHRPNRMLDHLFVAGALATEDARVGADAGDSSDHLPLWARLRLLSRS